MIATETHAGTGAVDRRTVATRGVVAIVLSVVANWVVLGAALASDVVEPFESLALPPVTFLTVVGVAGATGAYWLLAQRTARPDRTFAIVAGAVLVLSFLPDLFLLEADPDATVSGVLTLMCMHVVAAAICVAVLTGRLPLPVGGAAADG